MTLLIGNRKDKSIRQKVDYGWEWEVTANVYMVPFWGAVNVLKLDCGDGCTTSV